jgi:hypothetical protein
LASRGGRTRTSTRVPVFGASIQKGGLHQPPFSFVLQISAVHVFRSNLLIDIFTHNTLLQKLSVASTG